MENRPSAENEFIEKVTGIIEANLSDEHFGVPQLASELGMSRSTLHRKINSATKLSANQFIRQVRLKHAREMLRHTSQTVSEVAYKSGFSSPVYFSKCFHDYFGYPPVKVGNRDEDETDRILAGQIRKKRMTNVLISTIAFIIVAVSLILVFRPFSFSKENPEKSLVVLPPVFMGTDSTYYPQLNGVISLVIDKLSIIKDMEKVLPWQSVRQYRNSPKSAVKIARECDAGYVVESHGVLLENAMRINIKLINSNEGNQLWSNSYEIGFDEFIKIPAGIATNIAGQINAEITPEEKVRIEKMPTLNKTAW